MRLVLSLEKMVHHRHLRIEQGGTFFRGNVGSPRKLYSVMWFSPTLIREANQNTVYFVIAASHYCGSVPIPPSTPGKANQSLANSFQLYKTLFSGNKLGGGGGLHLPGGGYISQPPPLFRGACKSADWPILTFCGELQLSKHVIRPFVVDAH